MPAGQLRCGACLTQPPPLDACVAAVDYVWPWTECISRFKFRRDTGLTTALARLLLTHPETRRLLGRAHHIIPIPSTAERLRQRGYNPPLLLARRLARHRCRDDLLLRSGSSRPQRGLTRAERLRNVRGSFSVPRPGAVRHRRILLVDDVMTTGATLHAAARALRQAGCTQVVALVLARD